jgi:hypothetical protein
MEIGPVTNVRLVPTVKSRETDLGMTDVDDVERLSRIGDETYTPSGAKSETDSEDEEDKYEEEDLSDDLEEDEEDTETKPTALPAGNSQINYVA